MYIVIVGAGDIGRQLVEIATANGEEVVVIERNEKRAEAVAGEFDCLVLHDDATNKRALRDAKAERADALISTTDRDATNLMVSLLGEEFDVPDIVTVVHDPENMSLFRQIGIQTMENPQNLIAEYLYRSVKRPAIVDYMRVGEDAEVFEITVTGDAPIAGKTLQQAADSGLLGAEVLVVAIERNGDTEPITPRGDTEVQVADLVTVYSAHGATPELTDVFGHREDH